ncbi:MAG: hypothetical protein ACM3XZ_00130 [Betaproteobacteria bacterium]
MSIKPVDVGVMVQRMGEVDRTQQVRDQRAATDQQHFGMAMKADLERRETEVKGPPQTAKLSVNPDAQQERKRKWPEGQSPSGAREPAEPPKESGEEPPRPQSGRGQRLDIKL